MSTNDTWPAPLVPAYVDLRGYGFMPLYGHHLLGSEFNARCSDSEWRAGVTLWWASWNQVPAASLPNDDIALARLADLGRDVKGWKKLREHALHGFVLCSDGRLYHRFLAQHAMEAWARRVAERERKRKWREGRDGRRDGDTGRDETGTSTGTETGQQAGRNSREGQGEGEGQRTIENPLSKSPAQPSIVDCPQAKLREIYARHLPMLRQPRVWDASRADLLRKRWIYCSKANGIGSGYRSVEEGLAFWEKFFAYVATSKKLTEGIPYEDGTSWKPDLPWLLKAENFTKVVEGKFHE